MTRTYLEHLTTPCRMWRPYAFDRVTVSGRPVGETGSREILSFIGPVYSEFASGPNLLHLAEATAELTAPGMYGLHCCRPLGFRWQPGDELPANRFQLVTAGNLFCPVWDEAEGRNLPRAYRIPWDDRYACREALLRAETPDDAHAIATRFEKGVTT